MMPYNYFTTPDDHFPLNIPRRIRIDKMCRAELAIRDAIMAVEDMEADVRLTEAVVLLSKAKDKVADFVDKV